MAEKKKTIQITDIARFCKVGTATVSRVINGQKDVAYTTRTRVETAIRELGYVPAAAARNLRSHHPQSRTGSQTLAVVAAPKTLRLTAYAELLEVLLRKASGMGFIVVIESNAARLRPEHYNGAILFSSTEIELTAEIPIVSVDWFSSDPAIAGVLPDYANGIYQAAQTALGNGYQRPLLLMQRPTGDSQGFVKMMNAGFSRALHKAGISPENRILGQNVHSKEIAYQVATKLFKSKNSPDLIFTHDDAAMGVYRAAAEAGIRIPEELGVVGCDGISQAAYFNPPLATIAIGFEALADAALSRLIPTMNGNMGPYPQRVVLPTKFINARSIHRATRNAAASLATNRKKP